MTLKRSMPAATALRGGIDLGGTKILAVVMDPKGKVQGSARQPTPQKGGPPAVIAAMAASLKEAAAAAGLQTDQLAGIGVGAPGATDAKTGVLSHAGNLDNWEKPYPLSSKLSALAGPAVFLGNDVQVAVRGEHELGAGRGHLSMLGVWCGTGIGGGIILDGKPWIGEGAAGEIGHMVVRYGGARCTCGRRGCLEAYAGRAAMELRALRAHKRGEKTLLVALMKKKNRDRLVAGIWARALEENDPVATRLINRAVRMLGAGIASAMNVLDLPLVVIGGGLGGRLGQPFADRIAAAMIPHLKVPDRPRKVVVAALGEYSGALGAALLAPLK